jgi:D-ornithine 4,5-aminomutase subunit beta
MQHLHDAAEQRGLLSQLVLVAGGSQVTDALARAHGMDAGFGRGTSGREVASFLVRTLRAREAD